ncbi:transcription initiation factor IIB-like [Anopheles maculipalpis]|uniref:transcription initiation factor IIB-like n=1 Tax=Anopheles maculipalpis TaxID=1496333 RepID=UPI002158F535|nr:transcription initiation factor IIB-like [Anopheles maculipalpis]
MASNSSSSSNMNKLQCSYHPKADLIDDYHTGDMICSDCGLVVGDRIIDLSSEWRTFSDEKNREDPCRVGSTDPYLEDNDLSTILQSPKGEHFNDTKCYKMHPNTNKLVLGFAEISTMAERINAPKSIVNHAKNLFKRVQEVQELRHRSMDAKATACLYIACRQEVVPRTFKELCAVSSVSKKEIGRCFKLIVKTLATSLELITSNDFMSRFCTNLRLPMVVQQSATHIAQTAIKMDIVSGLSPISVAAAAIYMASQASDTVISNRNIAQIAGVAELTIRKAYKLMLPYAEELFPKNFNFFKHINFLHKSQPS